jgi:hypothetical protein
LTLTATPSPIGNQIVRSSGRSCKAWLYRSIARPIATHVDHQRRLFRRAAALEHESVHDPAAEVAAEPEWFAVAPDAIARGEVGIQRQRRQRLGLDAHYRHIGRFAGRQNLRHGIRPAVVVGCEELARA